MYKMSRNTKGTSVEKQISEAEVTKQYSGLGVGGNLRETVFLL